MAIEATTLKLHGHDVAVRHAGHGPAILLIHGMAGSSTTWQPIIGRLAERFTVICPDLPGHGRSDKPRGDYSLGAYASGLRDLLRELGCERATIVGQSLGGGIAMQFTYQYPQFCARMVLVGSGGLGNEVLPLLRALTFPGVEYLLPVAFPSFVRDGVESAASFVSRFGLRASPQVVEIWRSYSSLTDPETRLAFVQTLRSVIDLRGQRVSAEDKLYLAADIPTMIVWGERDPIIPVSHAYRAHEAMPGSRLEIFADTGHFPHCEEPERFAGLLVEFIDSTRAHAA